MSTHGDIPKKLSDLKKEIPFRVPGNYFEDFPARLQVRLEQEDPEDTGRKGTRVINMIKPALSLAAAFAAVFLIVYWPVRFVSRPHIAESNGQHDNILFDDMAYLTEGMDDNTFFSLFHNGSGDEIIESDIIASYLASCNSEYDIYLETLK